MKIYSNYQLCIYLGIYSLGDLVDECLVFGLMRYFQVAKKTEVGEFQSITKMAI